MTQSPRPSSETSPMTELRTQWGWFAALGVLFLILGVIALGNLFAATVVTIFFIGALMVVGGIAYIVHAFQVRTWNGFFFWLLSGLLYGLAGSLAFYNPLVAAAAITLIFGLSLVISGALRIGIGIRERPDGWGWIVGSGIITLLAGIVIAFGWPMYTPWLLGLVLAFDLMFQGIAALAFGLKLRSAR